MDDVLLDRAKQMRRDATDAERCLWAIVRSRRLAGHKFRRQVAVGPFIADFLCVAKRLIVEVDGGQHMSDDAYDVARSNWLAIRGYRVIRFWNNQVLTQAEAVAEQILREIEGRE